MRLEACLVNPPRLDPALFLQIPGRPTAYLIDCGYLYPLRFRDILRVGAVFVSHMHVNHFAGFDHWLRVSLAADSTVAFFGPPPLGACIRSKLGGYTWNLRANLRVRLEVVDVAGESHRTERFDGAAAFAPSPTETGPADRVLLQTPDVTVTRALLDHQIPCLGFAVQQRVLPAIRRDRLQAAGLKPGPWIEALKHLAAGMAPLQPTLEVDGRSLEVAALAEDLLEPRQGHKIAYITDTIFNKQTVPRMVELAKDADELYCEAPFVNRDKDLARQTCHLTAKQAAIVAQEAGVKVLRLFHFTRRYSDQPDVVWEEARAVFPAVEEAPVYAALESKVVFPDEAGFTIGSEGR